MGFVHIPLRIETPVFTFDPTFHLKIMIIKKLIIFIMNFNSTRSYLINQSIVSTKLWQGKKILSTTSTKNKITAS